MPVYPGALTRRFCANRVVLSGVSGSTARLPGSRGVRRVEGANLFFPEEMPDLIAEEARQLWGIGQ